MNRYRLLYAGIAIAVTLEWTTLLAPAGASFLLPVLSALALLALLAVWVIRSSFISRLQDAWNRVRGLPGSRLAGAGVAVSVVAAQVFAVVLLRIGPLIITSVVSALALVALIRVSMRRGVPLLDWHPRRTQVKASARPPPPQVDGKPHAQGHLESAVLAENASLSPHVRTPGRTVEWYPAYRAAVDGLRRGSVVRPVLLESAVLLVAFAAVFCTRVIHIEDSYDVHVDELTYVAVANSLNTRHDLLFLGSHFYVHPPLYMIIDALYLDVMRPAGQLQQVYATRYLTVLFAAGSGALLLLLGRQLHGWKAGLIASGIFALDPFVNRINSIDLLETPAVFWALLGWWLLNPVIGADDRRVGWRYGAAGVSFGLSCLTKEPLVFLTLSPLVVLTGWRQLSGRLPTLMTGLSAVLTYSVYPLVVALQGNWSEFKEQKLHSLLRLIGIIQETGFHQSHGPSLLQAVFADIDRFITTYLLLALGAVAIAVLFLVGDQGKRVLATWAGTAYLYLSYALLFGTLEEQTFYLPVVPAILVIAVSVTVLWPRLSRGRRWLHYPQGAAWMAATVLVTWSCITWTRVHFTPDNGYERMLEYMHRNHPSHTQVVVTTLTGDLLLKGDYDIVPWENRDKAPVRSPRLVQLSVKTVEQNYGPMTPAELRALQHQAQPLFAFDSRSFGTIAIYELDTSAAATRRGAAVDSPAAPRERSG